MGPAARDAPLRLTTRSRPVDPARGSDGNKGTFERPLATVTKAYSLTTDKSGDVVYLMNDGNTSGTSRDTATIAWANDNVHLIGLCAPSAATT